MPDLYIANCTKQNREIHFRLDFNPPAGVQRDFIPPTKRDVKPGQQVKIRDISIDQAEIIRAQLEPYGLLSVKEVQSAGNAVVPIIFNVDKAVKPDEIRIVMDHNDRVQIFKGRERRKKAAMSVNELVADAVVKSLTEQHQPLPDEIGGLDVEFEQVDQSEAGERRIEEGYRVSQNAPGPGAQASKVPLRADGQPRGKPGPKGPRKPK